MLQLVYISSSRGVITPHICLDILAVSRRNNDRQNVTGLLVAGERRFLQALEGPTDAVRATYARIQRDQRHYACVLLAERYADERQFGTWSMASIKAVSDGPVGATLAQSVEALTCDLADPDLRAQFNGFAELQSVASAG
ncbi:BLUF domain-containing protein [Sphingomonas kaistensis]|jgi:hypothetical protein|uniref:BLUF domain-containing protein n=1 Tax=Sphingomonas kaistensis TaxID=298708 RepID=A0ABZ2G4A9_9SPHN